MNTEFEDVHPAHINRTLLRARMVMGDVLRLEELLAVAPDGEHRRAEAPICRVIDCDCRLEHRGLLTRAEFDRRGAGRSGWMHPQPMGRGVIADLNFPARLASGRAVL